MNKNIYKYLFITILLSTLTYMGFMIYTNLKIKAIATERIKTLPYFEFKTLNNKDFKSTEIINTPTVIMYFNSNCEHCLYEISEVYRRRDAFQDYKVIMVSSEEITKLKQISKKYVLDSLSFVHILQDSKREFRLIFGSEVTPSIYIYSSGKQLRKLFIGETQIDAILQYLGKE